MVVPSTTMAKECELGSYDFASSPARPIDGADRGGGAQGGDDVGQVPHVLDLDIHQHLEEVDRAVGDLEIGDVAEVLADHRGQAAEAARLVGDDDRQAADMLLGRVRVLVPGDVEPAFRCFCKTLDRKSVV